MIVVMNKSRAATTTSTIISPLILFLVPSSLSSFFLNSKAQTSPVIFSTHYLHSDAWLLVINTVHLLGSVEESELFITTLFMYIDLENVEQR